MITPTDTAAEEFLAAARQTLRAAGGEPALASLDWWELLDSLDERELRFAAAAIFRAQGRELASTPALGSLMAQPYAALLDLDPRATTVAIVRDSARAGRRLLTLGETGDRRLLVDDDQGLHLYEAGAGRRRDLGVPGRIALVELDLTDAESTPVLLPEENARRARRRSIAFGRVALAAEMLGAAEGAVDLALEHARVRTQFGQPLGGFQAVRHLLAWAEADCSAVAAVVRQAVWFDTASAPGYDAVVKALAGRNARSACERSLQVLGGIGFTAEHDHHQHHSRVLALDGLLGTSASLTRELGERTRRAGALPAWTATGLAAEA